MYIFCYNIETNCSRAAKRLLTYEFFWVIGRFIYQTLTHFELDKWDDTDVLLYTAPGWLMYLPKYFYSVGNNIGNISKQKHFPLSPYFSCLLCYTHPDKNTSLIGAIIGWDNTWLEAWYQGIIWLSAKLILLNYFEKTVRYICIYNFSTLICMIY